MAETERADGVLIFEGSFFPLGGTDDVARFDFFVGVAIDVVVDDVGFDFSTERPVRTGNLEIFFCGEDNEFGIVVVEGAEGGGGGTRERFVEQREGRREGRTTVGDTADEAIVRVVEQRWT